MGYHALLSDDAAYADGQLTPFAVPGPCPDTDALVGDNTFSQRVGKLRANFPEVLSVPLAEEILDFMADEGWLNTHAPPNSIREKFSIVKVMEYFYTQKGRFSRYAGIWCWGIPALDDIVKHKCPEEVAREAGVTRQAVNKTVLKAQEFFGLGPRPDQRSMPARKKMRLARCKQLKPQPTKV
jgi:hypothetical protein